MNNKHLAVADVPELLAQWCFEKNLGKKPEHISLGSSKKVWWVCERGHQWDDSPGHRRAGRGCPYCSHHRLLPEYSLAAQYPNIVEEWDFEKNEKSPSEYASVSGEKVFWKCIARGHKWSASISSRTKKGSGCPYCSGRLAWPGESDLTTLFPDIAKEWHPNKNGDVKPNTVRPGCNTKYWWICEYGHEWEDTPNHRTNRKRGCPYCSHHRLLPENSLASKYPHIAAEWDYDNNQKTPSEYPAFSNEKVSWVCKSCGQRWYTSIASRTNLGSGCPICSNQTIVPDVNDLKTVNPLLADEWDYDLNDFPPSAVGAGSTQKVWWKCAFGHSWQAQINHRNRGTGCPVCRKYTRTSLQEYTFYFYIKQFFQDAVNSYKVPVLNRKEIDVFIPSNNVGIEYDGEFWHRSTKKDQEKDELCASLGITLIRIREPNCTPYMRSGLTLTLEDTSATSLQNAIEQVLKYLNVDSPSISIERDNLVILESYRDSAIKSSLSSRHPELAAEWHPTLNGSLLPENIPGTSSPLKVYWLCPTCKSAWKSSIDSRISKGSGCPVCAGRTVKTGYNDLCTTCPQLAAQWHPTKNGSRTPRDVTSHSHEKVWWMCDHGHEWQSTVKDRAKGNGCPVCAGRKVLRDYNDLAFVNPTLAEEWDAVLNEKTPYEVTAHSGYRAHWRCKTCGHLWSAPVYSRSAGFGCPMCSPKRRGNHRKQIT